MRRILIVGVLMACAPAYGSGMGHCPGGAIFNPVGGNPQGRFYKSPPMYEDYTFDGFVLKVARRDFHATIYGNAKDLLAEFESQTVLIRVTRLPQRIATLDAAVKFCAPKKLPVTKSYPIRSGGGVSGFKTVYGDLPKGYRTQEICTIYRAANGGFVCFRARPIAKYADWREANRLVTGALRYEKKK